MVSTSPVKVTRISLEQRNLDRINSMINQNIVQKRVYIQGIEQKPQENQILHNYDFVIQENRKLQDSLREITQLNNNNV